MNLTPLPRIAAAAAVVASVVALSACGSGSADTTPSVTPSVNAPAATSPSVSPTATPAAGVTKAGEVTCDALIPEETVKAFTDAGWTSREQTFRLGATELPDGIWCEWADFSVVSDHLQIFGWAPIDEDEAAAAQDELVEAGWRREDAGDRVYVTENPDTAVAVDDAGYGMTYEFGPNWVTVSDTKQSLVLIERPVG
jgi:hypothetical protein